MCAFHNFLIRYPIFRYYLSENFGKPNIFVCKIILSDFCFVIMIFLTNLPLNFLILYYPFSHHNLYIVKYPNFQYRYSKNMRKNSEKSNTDSFSHVRICYQIQYYVLFFCNNFYVKFTFEYSFICEHVMIQS